MRTHIRELTILVDIEEKRRSARVSPIFPTFSLGFSLQDIWDLSQFFFHFSLQEMSLSCLSLICHQDKLFGTSLHHIKRQEGPHCTLESGLLVLVVNCLLVVNLQQFQFWGFERRAGLQAGASCASFRPVTGNQVRDWQEFWAFTTSWS